jgi:hypothetical protein
MYVQIGVESAIFWVNINHFEHSKAPATTPGPNYIRRNEKIPEPSVRKYETNSNGLFYLKFGN